MMGCAASSRRLHNHLEHLGCEGHDGGLQRFVHELYVLAEVVQENACICGREIEEGACMIVRKRVR